MKWNEKKEITKKEIEKKLSEFNKLLISQIKSEQKKELVKKSIDIMQEIFNLYLKIMKDFLDTYNHLKSGEEIKVDSLFTKDFSELSNMLDFLKYKIIELSDSYIVYKKLSEMLIVISKVMLESIISFPESMTNEFEFVYDEYASEATEEGVDLFDFYDPFLEDENKLYN